MAPDISQRLRGPPEYQKEPRQILLERCECSTPIYGFARTEPPITSGRRMALVDLLAEIIGSIALKIGRSVELSRIITQEWLCEEDAFSAERFLIACYGRKDNGTGILRNLTDGGDGPAGWIRTQDWRSRVSSSLKGNQNALGNKFSEDANIRSHAWLNTPKGEAHKQRLAGLARDAALASHRSPTRSDPAWREKQKQRVIQGWTPEARARESERQKARHFHHSEESRRRMSDTRRGKKRPEETKARMRAAWVIRKENSIGNRV